MICRRFALASASSVLIAHCSALYAAAPPPASAFFRDPVVAAMAEALAKGDTNAAMLARSKGADVDAKGRAGLRPLDYVVAYANDKSVGSVRALIAAGADVNSTDDSGMTPLGAAAARSDTAILSALLSAGARPAMPSQGVLPVLTAAESGNQAAFQILATTGSPLTGSAYAEGSLAAALAHAGRWPYLTWMVQRGIATAAMMPPSFWIQACGSSDPAAASAAQLLSSQRGARGCPR